jgi:serine/threonine protein phosphatase PrpC
VLSDGEIATALRESPEPGEALAELVEAVNRRGAPDNATAVSVLMGPPGA